MKIYCSCKKCKKGFQYTSLLKENMKVHTHKRLFKCNKCTRKFMTKWVRDQQLKTHENIDKFNCEVCSFKSNSSYNLQQHVHGKHGRGWKSPCGHRFLWKLSVAYHKKNAQIALMETIILHDLSWCI